MHDRCDAMSIGEREEIFLFNVDANMNFDFNAPLRNK